MNPCQEAKLIVDAIIGLKKSSYNIPRLTVIGYLSSAKCEKTRLVREITAYLMTLKNREDAAKVASLIEMAYANTNMELPMLAMVQQKTFLHDGRFLALPPNPDVTDDGFVLTSLPDEHAVVVKDVNQPVVVQMPEEEDWELV